MIKSKTRVGHPARLFRYDDDDDDDDDDKKMQVQFARIVVLYDDLMREFAGAGAFSGFASILSSCRQCSPPGVMTSVP
jgi:hypothetical protein